MHLVVIVLVSLVSIPAAFGQGVTDHRIWLGAGVDAGLGPRVRLGAQQQLRLGADAGFDETHTQLEASFRLADPIRIGVLYRFAVTDVENRHRFGVDGRLQGRFGDVTASYRLRLQETTRPSKNSDQFLVRNRGTIAVQVGHHVEPFISFELHHQLSPKAEYREFRFEIGAAWRMSKQIELEGSYMFQTESNVDVPETNHVLAAGLTYHFGNLRKGDSEPGSHD